jgi:hypothetical protein
MSSLMADMEIFYNHLMTINLYMIWFQGYHGQSAGVNTVSQSATTMKSTTNTSETKKKKPQEDQIPTVV